MKLNKDNHTDMKNIRQFAYRDKRGVQRGRQINLTLPLNEQDVVDDLSTQSCRSVTSIIREYMLAGFEARGVKVPPFESQSIPAPAQAHANNFAGE